jgi:hypothetical protein
LTKDSKDKKSEEKEKPDNPWDGDPKLVRVMGASGSPQNGKKTQK